MPLGFFEQFKKEKTPKERIQEDIQDAKEELSRYEKIHGEVPERLAPLFKLHTFNNSLLERNALEGALPGAINETFKFHKIIDEEWKAEENPYLPTIGVEIEIPRELEHRPNRILYEATEDLGVPNGYDQAWEFATPFSYSAKAQSSPVHELIRGGYIPTEFVEGTPKIMRMYASLHVNEAVDKKKKKEFFLAVDVWRSGCVNLSLKPAQR